MTQGVSRCKLLREKAVERTPLIASVPCTGLLFAAKEVSGMVLDRSFGGYNVIYGAYAAISLSRPT